MPAILPAVAAVGGLIGTGITVAGQLQQGKEQKQAQEYNAQISEQEADIVRQNAVLNEYKARKSLAQSAGTQIAGYAKSGVNFTGSPLDVIADSIANAELDISINKWNSENEARGKESEARMRRYYGLQDEKLAKTKAVSTLLTEGTQGIYRLSKEKIGE